MPLPFTVEQFLGVFGDYNRALWPAAVALWVATLVWAVIFARGQAGPRFTGILLAVHWAWSGVAYHAVFFTRINPAAWIFSALFVVQAVAFLRAGVARRRMVVSSGRSAWTALAVLFLGYSLAYPLLVIASGHSFPNAPGFALPCPTSLFTAAVLLAAAPSVSGWLFVVPVSWSIVGGSAAVLLGMTPDLMLLAAAGCLLVRWLMQR